MLEHFKIPSIFISSFRIPETRFNDTEFVCYTNSNFDDKYVFIVVPTLRDNQWGYKVIVNNDNSIFISLDEISNGKCKEKLLDTIQNSITIYRYMDTFKREPKLKPKLNPEFEIIEDKLEDIKDNDVNINKHSSLQNTNASNLKLTKPKPILVLEDTLDKNISDNVPETIEIIPKQKKTKRIPITIKLTSKKTKKQK